MLRRMLLSSFGAALASPYASARPKLGDAEWMRRFGVFLRELNEFVFAINEERLDRTRWDRVRSAWAELEDKTSCDR